MTRHLAATYRVDPFLRVKGALRLIRVDCQRPKRNERRHPCRVAVQRALVSVIAAGNAPVKDKDESACKEGPRETAS